MSQPTKLRTEGAAKVPEWLNTSAIAKIPIWGKIYH